MNILCGTPDCSVLLNSTCVFYEGANLIYTGINTNDSLQTSLQKIDSVLGAGYGAVSSLTSSDNSITLSAPTGNVNLTLNTAHIYTWSGIQVFNAGVLINSVANTNFSPLYLTGSLYRYGSGSNTLPYMYLNQGTSPTDFSVQGSYFGINTMSGFTGDILTLYNNGSNVYRIDSAGKQYIKNDMILNNNSIIRWGGTGSTYAVYSDGANYTTLSSNGSYIQLGNTSTNINTGILSINSSTNTQLYGQVLVNTSGMASSVLFGVASTSKGSIPMPSMTTTQRNAIGSVEALMVYDNTLHVPYYYDGTTWKSMGGSTVSLTTTGTSGASTYSGGTLNIPVYQGQLTLTTTGSSGSATLVSNTLNIPTYTLAGLGGISLTSLSASAPLNYNNTTGAFTISQANGSTNGYLSSSDWTTFNNKQGTITLTTTGTSGAATLIGTTLNIPQYSGAITSVSNSDGTLTISPTTGAVVASLNLGHSNTWTAAGAASTPAMTWTGAVYTGGTGTTTLPYFYYNTSGNTAPTTWSTSGTILGMNAPSGFGGNFIDFRINGGNSKYLFNNSSNSYGIKISSGDDTKSLQFWSGNANNQIVSNGGDLYIIPSYTNLYILHAGFVDFGASPIINAGYIAQGTTANNGYSLDVRGTNGVYLNGNITVNGGTLAGASSAVNAQTGTTYTLVAGDNGKVVTLNNASAITLTVPAGLGAGFNCIIIQLGAGQVTISPSSTTINNNGGFTKTAGQYAAVTLVAYVANTFISQGNMA